jgi:hypothetical protein
MVAFPVWQKPQLCQAQNIYFMTFYRKSLSLCYEEQMLSGMIIKIFVLRTVTIYLWSGTKEDFSVLFLFHVTLACTFHWSSFSWCQDWGRRSRKRLVFCIWYHSTLPQNLLVSSSPISHPPATSMPDRFPIIFSFLFFFHSMTALDYSDLYASSFKVWHFQEVKLKALDVWIPGLEYYTI